MSGRALAHALGIARPGERHGGEIEDVGDAHAKISVVG
jgi:hypothetical protein